MKILFLTPSLNEKSGWGRHARAIITNLQRAGLDVEVFSEDVPLDVSYKVYTLSSLTSRFSVFTLLINMLRVRRASKSFDIVHALDGWPLGVYGYGAVLGTRKSFFMNGIGTYSVAPLYAFGKKIIMRLVYGRVQKVFCISNYTKQELIDGGVNPHKLEVVHYGVPDFIKPTNEEVEEFCKKNNITRDITPIIVTVGAIKDRKGQLDTLKAVEMIKKQYPLVLYIVAGSTGDIEYVSNITQYAHANDLTKNLLICKNASDKEIAILYKLCTVFVLASTNDKANHHFEGFGAVITEASQFGKPAVGNKGCGIEDAIQDGVSGLLSQQRDPQDIATNIQKVLDDYERFAAGAIEFGRQFSWIKTINEYVTYYNQKNGL